MFHRYLSKEADLRRTPRKGAALRSATPIEACGTVNVKLRRHSARVS